jgi:pimeloyl-ACP methyl ester carboxylesterase
MNIVTFSGWGQAPDSLDNIAPNANHIKYRDFADVDSVFTSIANVKCDVLIGWSLGGQLALRAVDNGVLKPKLIVLLATPFQFLSGKGFKSGMDGDTFHSFEMNFQNNPEATLEQFALLIAKNDSEAKRIITYLKAQPKQNPDKWAHWLEELRNFSCSKLNFTNMPKTIAIHGRDDTIVDVAQAGILHPLIADYTCHVFEKCGHAPHLHDEKKVIELIDAAL